MRIHLTEYHLALFNNEVPLAGSARMGWESGRVLHAGRRCCVAVRKPSTVVCALFDYATLPGASFLDQRRNDPRPLADALNAALVRHLRRR